MQTITITNDFHNTEARVRPAADGTITKRQYQRAMRKLCGASDCTCGGERNSRFQLIEDTGGLGIAYYVSDSNDYRY